MAGKCSDACYMLKDGDSEWELHSSMPTKRYACKAFASQSELCLVGGRVLMEASNAVESVDLESRSWTSHPDILVNRLFGAMVQHGDLVYVLGGLAGPKKFVNSAEVFNMEKKSWKNLAPLPSRRADMATGKCFLKYGHGEYV